MRSLVLLLAAAACGGGSTPPDADEALACLHSGKGQIFAVGLAPAEPSAKLDVKLMSATPAPPMRDFNTWEIQVSQMAGGAPLSGATITVAPFMPDHQHGPGAYQPRVQAMPEAGRYKIEQINTWMPGYWTITIAIGIGENDRAPETVVYKFCIQA